MQKDSKNRLYYIDLLRVLACLSVIMIHCTANYVTTDIGSFNFWVANILDALAKIAVPIFVMISGALLLDEKYESTKEKTIKRIKKFAIFFIFWSALYTILFYLIGEVAIKHKPFYISNVINLFFNGFYHLWFIYLIIGLYLIVPLLRLWVKDENKKEVKYFLILSIIFAYLIPQVINIASYYNPVFDVFDNILNNSMQLQYVGGFTAYFILGWYLNNYDIKHKKAIYLLGILSLYLTIIGTYILSDTLSIPTQMYGNLTINILFQSIALFLFVKESCKSSKDNVIKKCVLFISKNSLGIYAIHAGIVTILFELLDKTNNIAIITIPIVFLSSFFLSLLITFVLSKIPIIKKVVQ